MALNTIYNGIDSKVFEQIKDLEKASEVWVRLEETYEGTSKVKSAKLYMLKDKLSNFKMKDDESILEMFYRLQVIINDLKSLMIRSSLVVFWLNPTRNTDSPKLVEFISLNP